MKYSNVRVKCSDRLLIELDKFKAFCSDDTTGYVEDFINEAQEGIAEAMADARLTHNLNEDGTVFSEMRLVIPHIVWAFIKSFIHGKEEDYTEIGLFFEEIGRIQDAEFKRGF